MNNTNIYAADFETSVYEGQTDTEVWSSSFCPIRRTCMLQKGEGHEPEESDVIVLRSIKQSIEWLEKQDRDIMLYYHNLKFDGTFWCDWLEKNGYTYHAKENKKDPDIPMTYSALISGMGQWYSMHIILSNGHTVELRDSLKLIPFSLKKAGKDFGTKHQKLEMEYTGKRTSKTPITDNEMSYIKNDVLVLAELIEMLYKSGYFTEKDLTIGSACMNQYKKTVSGMYWKDNFWQLDDVATPEYVDANNADEYIRKAYRGGWCYAKEDKAGKVYNTKNRITFTTSTRTSNDEKIVFRDTSKGATTRVKYIGLTADVNSLYPSMMHSMSGNRYPIGKPHFVKGDTILEHYYDDTQYSFIHFKCKFKLKKDKLPFVQIKGNELYKGNEMLTDSRPTYHGKKVDFVKYEDGSIIDDTVELTMTCTDYKLFHKHYDVSCETILDGCWFYTDIGMFDDYIDYWAEIKKNAPHGSALRAIAKLMLNNLYGKFSTSPVNISKIPKMNDDGILSLEDDIEPDKKTVNIAIGAAITSYARNFTITAAQKNYSSFCYADTDSIHCLCSAKQVNGIKIHPTNFCCWKLESFWNEATFVRQKTYIEHVCCEDEKPIEAPYYNIKCAGMPESCKSLLNKSITQSKPEEKLHALVEKQMKDDGLLTQFYEKEKFLSKQRTLKDFTHGLTIPGKLMPKRIPGGTLLVTTTYTMK